VPAFGAFVKVGNGILGVVKAVDAPYTDILVGFSLALLPAPCPKPGLFYVCRMPHGNHDSKFTGFLTALLYHKS